MDFSHANLLLLLVVYVVDLLLGVCETGGMDFDLTHSNDLILGATVELWRIHIR